MNRTFAPALAAVLALAACGPADADNGAAPAHPSAASGQDMPAIPGHGVDRIFAPIGALLDKHQGITLPELGKCAQKRREGLAELFR